MLCNHNILEMEEGSHNIWEMAEGSHNIWEMAEGNHSTPGMEEETMRGMERQLDHITTSTNRTKVTVRARNTEVVGGISGAEEEDFETSS